MTLTHGDTLKQDNSRNTNTPILIQSCRLLELLTLAGISLHRDLTTDEAGLLNLIYLAGRADEVDHAIQVLIGDTVGNRQGDIGDIHNTQHGDR